jgi:hypothetical protein
MPPIAASTITIRRWLDDILCNPGVIDPGLLFAVLEFVRVCGGGNGMVVVYWWCGAAVTTSSSMPAGWCRGRNPGVGHFLHSSTPL